MKIVDLAPRPDLCEGVARLLVEGFRQRTDAYARIETARKEVAQSLAPDRISRVALDGESPIGWIGGLVLGAYDGRVWELHPLVVDPAWRGQGVGRALVEDLERLVAERGALTLYLGTDDERSETTLADANLYDDLPEKLRTIRNLKGHPYEFYAKLGFRIVGVLPDADGRGKPDIYMAKRIG